MIAPRRRVETFNRIIFEFTRAVAIASAIVIARGRVDFPRIVVLALFLRRGGESGSRESGYALVRIYTRGTRQVKTVCERGDVRGAAACIGEVTFRFLFSTKFKTGTADEAIGEVPREKREKL